MTDPRGADAIAATADSLELPIGDVLAGFELPLRGHLDLDLEVSTAWRLRALEAQVGLHRVREAPALFAGAGVERFEAEADVAGRWATWWQMAAYGAVGRLP